MNRYGPAVLLILGGLLLAFSGGGVMPSPGPQPGPEPSPKRGSVVLLILETSPTDPEFTAAAAAIRSSDKYFAKYEQRGLSFRPYDQHSEAIGADLKRAVSEFKVPVLAILDDEENVIYVGPCPTTLAAFDAKVKEVTGR